MDEMDYMDYSWFYNHRLQCKPHGVIACAACYVDEGNEDNGYSDDDYDDDQGYDRMYAKLTEAAWIRHMRDIMRTPSPVNGDSKGTSRVAVGPNSSPSPPPSRPSEDQPDQTRTRPQFVTGLFVGNLFPPSPAQPQCNTLQTSPKMIHLVRPISDRPAEKQPRVGTGRVLPKKFVPPNTRDMPQLLFPPTGHRGFTSSPVPRFVRDSDPRQLLIYTDGACSNNGGLNPRGGCSFIYRTSKPSPSAEDYVRFPLESVGPTGERHTHTSNRAELRAVIAALRFRSWDKEEFDCLVIATDSDYVVKGITSWVKAWRRKGWKTRSGTAVKNKDLWQCLLGEIERADENGLLVKFWWIPRQWNMEADHHAKAAVDEAPLHEFTDTIGVFS